DQSVVVIRDGLRFAKVGQVLAEAREEHTDAVRAEWLGRGQRFMRCLAWHETAHRASGERKARKVLLEPPVAGHPKQDVAHVRPPAAMQSVAPNLPRGRRCSTVHNDPS